MSKKLTTKEFIERAKEVHGNKYDYSKVEYVNTQTKVCIICPIHGEFWQTPCGHLHGYGCSACGHANTSMKKTLSTEEFIERAKKIHGDKYDYSKVKYNKFDEKVCIVCLEHGEFWQTPNVHLNGQGCPKCGNLNKKYKQLWTTEKFIEKAREKHGDKYDYSKVNYSGAYKRILIKCPKHGEFYQGPVFHLRGYGCPECSKEMRAEKRKMTTEEFIERAKKIHGDYYDYSKVKYNKFNEKVCIICPIHGEFWQRPQNHLQGKGCFECSNIMNSNESRLFRLLTEKYDNQKVTRQYHNNEIIGQKSIDIFLEDYNIGIEYQGEQHFKPVGMFGGYRGFLDLAERDIKKYEECKNAGIKLLYFTFDKKTIPDNYIERVYSSFNDLCDEIDLLIKNNDI